MYTHGISIKVRVLPRVFWYLTSTNKKARRANKKERKKMYLDSSDAGVLGNVLVLMETLLGDLALAKGDAQLDKLEHDGLQRDEGNTARSLGDDDIVKSLEGSGVLTDGDELYETRKGRRMVTMTVRNCLLFP